MIQSSAYRTNLSPRLSSSQSSSLSTSVFMHKCGLSCFFACPFPLFQAAFIRRYTSKGMLDRSPPEIGRHLRKTDIKIKTGLVFFRGMYQMFCSIKTSLCLRDPFQFFPCLSIDLCQVTDCRPVDLQCLADRDILFS